MNATIQTHTSEYSVKDCCLALELTNGDYIFADEIRFDGSDVVYIPRCRKRWMLTGNTSEDRIARLAVACVTVGICPRE